MSVVCVAGMHRSGTSMVTRLLNLCGLYLGHTADLLPPTSDNSEGYWENIKFLQINEAILSHFHGGWDLPPVMEAGWEKAPELSAITPQAQELLRQFEGHEPWGWKDPRNSLTLPFWLQLIPDLKVIICLRHPLEVARSLNRRGYSSPAFSFNLWTVYNQRLLTAIPAEQLLITHYDTYFKRPQEELLRLLEFTGIPQDLGRLELALTSIAGNQRHNQATMEELRTTEAPPEMVDLYATLCAQSGPYYPQAVAVSPTPEAMGRGEQTAVLAADPGAEPGATSIDLMAKDKCSTSQPTPNKRRRSHPHRNHLSTHFTLYINSKGNYFFGEIRDLLAAGLKELGYGVRLSDETHGFNPNTNWHVVIAPHEFFFLGAGGELRRGNLPPNLILVNTEQPSTQWAALSASLFDRATHIWDINAWSAEQIRQKGYEVQVLPLGYVEGFAPYREIKELPYHYGTCFLEPRLRRRSYLSQPWAQRPIDVLFVGGLTPRREAFFAQAAPVFSRYQTYIHLADSRRPIIPGLSTYMNTTTVIGLAQRAKVSLNIHRDRDQYFEWHRVVLLGIWQKNLVISESSQPAPPFVANVDYVETPLQEMLERLEYYLASPQGQREAQEIVEHGYHTLTQHCRLADALRPLLEQILPG